MTFSEPSKEFIKATSDPQYYHPRDIDGYIKRYKTQIEFGYDQLGYCQGLIDLLEELKELREEVKELREQLVEKDEIISQL